MAIGGHLKEAAKNIRAAYFELDQEIKQLRSDYEHAVHEDEDQVNKLNAITQAQQQNLNSNDSSDARNNMVVQVKALKEKIESRRRHIVELKNSMDQAISAKEQTMRGLDQRASDLESMGSSMS